MRAVNLLPKELQQSKSIRHEDPAVVVGSALAVIVIISLSASFVTAHRKSNAEQKRLTAARLVLAQLSERKRPKQTAAPAVPVTPILPPPTITGQEATWLSAVGTTLSQRIAWDRILREVSLVMPDDVTLTSLTLSAPTAATVAAPPGAAAATQGFNIAGTAYSYDSVARLLSRLSLVPDLSNVTLTNTSAATQDGATTAVQFGITAQVKGAPSLVAPAPTTTATPPSTGTTTAGGSA